MREPASRVRHDFLIRSSPTAAFGDGEGCGAERDPRPRHERCEEGFIPGIAMQAGLKRERLRRTVEARRARPVLAQYGEPGRDLEHALPDVLGAYFVEDGRHREQHLPRALIVAPV